MKEYIGKRLDEIKDVKSKIILRDALESIFSELYDETERKYDALRERVMEELPLELDRFCIYTGLLEKSRLDGSHRYLFPMLEEDLEPLPAVETGTADVRFATVFLEADHLDCKELGESGQLWKGTIQTGVGEIRARFRLAPSERYLPRIEQLYRLFGTHNIPWVTVNSPYLFKMFDVFVVDAELPQDDAKAQPLATGFHIECGRYENRLHYDLYPVWNVHKRSIKGEDFPMPALDKVNYEYRFDLTEEGAEHGYLADGDEVIGARREQDSFVVTSAKEKGLRWELYKVWQPRESVGDRRKFDVVSNKQQDSFAGRMMAHYGAMIKTKSELARLLQSFEAARYVKFISFQISWGAVPGESYEVNRFIIDEVRDPSCTKTMLLRFFAEKRGDIIARDIVSFLVSQVQLVYPEYSCVGVLV